MEPTIYRLLSSNDFSAIILLMEEVETPIAGIKSRDIYESFCRYVLDNEKVVFTVAETDSKLVGFSIIIIDYRLFWRKFLANHKQLFLKILFRKLFSLLKNIQSNQKYPPAIGNDYYLTETDFKRTWKDSSPDIAKVLYVAVKKEYRQRGIGQGIYKFHHMALLQKGVKRLDSKINRQNIASIKLAYAEGRKIVNEKNGMLFTTIDL